MPDPGPERSLARLIENYKPRVIASSFKNLSQTFVETCHSQKALVIVDDGGPGSWAKMFEWGVDGIQTDKPADLIKLLKERGNK